MKRISFCETKFRSMLVTSTLTLAIIYLMLLSDNIIAGIFIGKRAVAAINAITPITGALSFVASIISIGTSILYSREMGVLRKRRADEFYGQGLILSIGIAFLTALLLSLCKDIYFRENNTTGEIYELASAYYRLTPLNAILVVINTYLTRLVYVDGDEMNTNLSFAAQIGGNILFSILLVQRLGITGIILGTIIGNAVGILVVCRHFFHKSSTLHFVWHFSFVDLSEVVRYSIVDAVLFFCWAVMDYVMISHVSERYGEMGQVTLAVVIGLLEFNVVLDGVGMAIQPLIETYLGEKNRKLVRRLMRIAMKAAIIEGLAATVLIFVFSRQFCFLYGIKGGAELGSAVNALRIVSMGLVFCSMIAIITSYYLLVDHVALSAGITVLKDGLLYSLLPIASSMLLGENAMWAAFAVSPLVALILSLLFIRLRYGKEAFPHLLENTDTKIIVLDDILTGDSCVRLSVQTEEAMQAQGCSAHTAVRAAQFVEEAGMTILEKNAVREKPILIEISLLFEDRSVLLIERDSGEIFDLANPDQTVSGLSSFVLSGLMETQKEKANLTTTGYNRNMIRFSTDIDNQERS